MTEDIRKLRLACRHLNLVECYDFEYDLEPPRRICTDCGAEEEGWKYGYQVLVSSHGVCREPTLQLTCRDEFNLLRKFDSVYLVGQSHPNFKMRQWGYLKLTEIPDV